MEDEKVRPLFKLKDFTLLFLLFNLVLLTFSNKVL